MSDTSTQPLLEPGTVIDERYEIGAVLGEGGMATIYEARHVFIERTVALKVLAVEPGKDDGFAERFLDEARLAARIEHPNVATVHDFGFVETRIGRRPYIAMARLHGHDLAVELRRYGALEPQRAVRLALRALDALGSAHRLGIVHKDLKPENLFLTRPATDEEDLQLLDFGIAGLLDTPNRRTSTGFLAGTPNYLAPEYIEHSQLSPALDVYQMGLIIIEMMTGQTVVVGRSPYEILRRHCTGRLEIPEVLREGELGNFFDRALQADPAARFPNATAMRVALEARSALFAELDVTRLVPEPKPPRPDQTSVPTDIQQVDADTLWRDLEGLDEYDTPGPVAAAAPPAHRRRRRRLLLVALMIVLGVVLGVTVILVVRESREREDAAPERQASEGSVSPAGAAEPAVASVFEVRLDSEPAGSRVMLDGVQMATTPATLMFGAEAGPVTVVLELEGYEATELSFVPAPGLALDTRLTPSAPAAEVPLATADGAALGAAAATGTAATLEPTGDDAPPKRTDTKKRDRTRPDGKRESFEIIP